MPAKKQADDSKTTAWLEKAHILTEALPFMQKYDGCIVVIKFGGRAMSDKAVAERFAQDVVLLKQAGLYPVIVHGGGKQINDMLQRLGIEPRFNDGVRITDAETVEVVEMVLSGAINKQLVSVLNMVGGKAVGLSGRDGNLILAKKKMNKITDPDSNIEKITGLGFVGEPEKVNADILDRIFEADMIPVIAPTATSAKGEILNINADTAAGAIAAAVHAERLLLLTDVAGVLDEKGEIIKQLSAKQAEQLIKKGVVRDGMIPKLETAITARQNGVKGVVILDGHVPHAILLELFTALGVGTLIS